MRKLLILLLGLLLVACGSENNETATPDFDSGVSDRPPVAAEATDQESFTPEPDVNAVFTIEIGNQEQFTQENGDYSYDYEEPTGNQANEANPQNNGLYTMIFTNDNAEVRVIFSDEFRTGTYPVEQNATVETGILAATVQIDDTIYDNLTDGELTFDTFADGMVTGNFDFTLANSDETQDVELVGMFDPLPLNTIDSNALNNEIGSEPLDEDTQN